MRVLGAHTSHGWVQVWTLPGNPEVEPETAMVAGAPRTAQAAATVAFKGRTVPWEEWARTLARRSPYGFWFAVTDVPAPAVTAQDALSWLRSHDGLLPPIT